MIVGNRHITDADILTNRDNLMVLAQRSVPSCCQRSAQLESNQLYFILTKLRDNKMLNYKSKQRILADLVPSVQSVAGTVEAVYDIEDVLLAADTNEIFRSIFGEEETNLSASELHTAIDLVLRRSEN